MLGLVRIQGTKGQNGQLSFIGLLRRIWKARGPLGALPNATLRYKTVPGTHGSSVFHSKRTNRELVPDGAEGSAEPRKCKVVNAVLKALVFRYTAVGLSSYWPLQHPNKAGTRFPPELESPVTHFSETWWQPLS